MPASLIMMVERNLFRNHKWVVPCVIRYFVAIIALCSCLCTANAQMLIGTKGLVNVPTAEMFPKKTFVGGANYIGENVVYYDYPVFNYYISFTPLTFAELTFRSTIIKEKFDRPSDSYCEQDRSFTVRVRLLTEKEGMWWPSIVVGSNDFYSHMGHSYYAALYGVATKHFNMASIGKLGTTVGYSHLTGKGNIYGGAFGGLSFQPSGFDALEVMADYDTKGVNIGACVNVFRHWNFLVCMREFKRISAGFAYQYTIKY